MEFWARMAAELCALGAPIQYTKLSRIGHNAWEDTDDRPDGARLAVRNIDWSSPGK